MSRRAFLKDMAVSGLAATGLASATWRLGTPEAALAQPAGSDPIEDLAHDLAYDVEGIFRFVADSIRYEPYSGTLRGAAGA